MLFIRKLYRLIGIINLALSILFISVALEMEISERLFGFAAINLGYHMSYWFFANVYKFPSNASENFGKAFWHVGSKIFVIFGFFTSFLITFKFISDAILFKEYYRLLALCWSVGIFLGSCFSRIKMKKALED